MTHGRVLVRRVLYAGWVVNCPCCRVGWLARGDGAWGYALDLAVKHCQDSHRAGVAA